MIKVLLLGLTGGLALVSCAVPAAGDVSLRSAAQIGSAPKFDSPTGSHDIVGICVDIYRAIEGADPGLRIIGDQTWLPAIRIEQQIVDGKLDIACGFPKSQAFQPRYVFIEPKLFTFEFHMAVRAGDDADVHDWNDVRRLGPQNVVLVNHGWAYSSRVADIGGLRIDDSGPTPDVNLHKLVAGRGRFYYFRMPGFVHAIVSEDLCEEVRVLPSVLEYTDVYLIAGHHVPAAIVDRLGHALQVLNASGQLASIKEKWSPAEESTECNAGEQRLSMRRH
jgi:hypothetical protein